MRYNASTKVLFRTFDSTHRPTHWLRWVRTTLSMYSGDENDDDDNVSYPYSDDEDMNSEDYGGQGGSEVGDDDSRMLK